MLSLSKTYTEFFKVDSPSHDTMTSYLRESWSYAFGMYALSRTVIEALSIMRRMVKDVSPVGDYYEQNIKRIVHIANDVVKHPTFKHGVVSEACEPVALSLNGEIDIMVWSDSGNPSKLEINPMKDFEVVHDYCEHVAAGLVG